MTIPNRPSVPNVGRLTTAVLFLVALICVAMIGGTAYLKFQMDRAESLLAAPDAAMGSDQDLFGRLRRSLGYGGFLGLAQNYVAHHDETGFAQMKDDIKSANDTVAHFPDKTSAETRHDLTAIVGIFDNALQRMNAPASDPAGEFTAADLTPLYAALPILDARVAASTAQSRLAAENEMHFWGMLLTLVSWCSLIIAAACAAGIYLTLRDKHSAPMRALAQSIQNMARGDMRTPIWGTERQDMVGELARAVDGARYHFSHLPDISVLSEQGPVRMRFEGGSRSLFEAMMKAISRDSENIRDQTVSLSSAVSEQKNAIATMSQNVETVLQNIMQRGLDGDRQIKLAIQDMVGSTENLKNAHAHSADQLNRIIPIIQDRAQGLSEIAHITGKQVASTLQSLTVSEMNLKANSELAKETLGRLFSTADDLSERLFGAINLLQASGKVLAQTTDDLQSRLGSGESLARSVGPAPVMDAEILSPLLDKLEDMAQQLADLKANIERHSELESKVAALPSTDQETQNLLRDSQIGYQSILEDIQSQLESLEAALAQQTTEQQIIAQQTLAQQAITQQMLTEHTAVTPAVDTQGNKIDFELLSASFRQIIADQVQPRFSDLKLSIDESIARQNQDVMGSANQGFNDLQNRIETIARSVAVGLDRVPVPAPTAEEISARIERELSPKFATLEKLSEMQLAQQPEWQAQLKDNWLHVASQIEASRTFLDKVIQDQVSGKIASFDQVLASLRDTVTAIKMQVDNPPKPTFTLPPELQKQMHDHWFQVTAQIEASRSSMIDAVAYQLDTMENRMAANSGQSALSRTSNDYATQRQIEQQTQILSELVATLSALDAHMQQIKTEMRSSMH